MKFGQGYRHQLQGPLGPVSQELDGMYAALTAWRESQHDIDGGHTDLTCDSATINGRLTMAGPWEITRVSDTKYFIVEPLPITADQDDFAPNFIDTAVWLRIRSDAARTITGLRHYDAMTSRLLIVQNTGLFTITFPHEGLTSAARYRIRTPNQLDYLFEPGELLWMLYDGDDHRWRIVQNNPLTAAKLNQAGVLTAANFHEDLLAGGSAGDFTVTGIVVADAILTVTQILAAGGVADLTAEFTITAPDTINNAGGTDTTGDQIQVRWIDQT